MSLYYPQAAVILRVRWEDFGTTDPELQKEYTIRAIPKRVQVNINDYTTADTFECELDYKSFPFDPRTMRSVGISIFLEDQGRLVDDSNQYEQIKPGPANILFQGFADDESITFDDDRRLVKLEGRDFTGILIDAKYLAGTPLDTGQPLNEIIKTLVTSLPAAKNLIIENRTGNTLPTLKQFYPGFGAPLAGQRNTGRDDTYWEVIQDLAAHAGVIVYVEIDKLVISKPRVLYNKKQAKQFIYGRNVKNMEFKRKLGRHKGFNIIVRCLDVLTKQVIDAKLPEEGTNEWAKSTGIPNKQVLVPVVGVNTQPQAHNQNQPAPYMAFRVTNVADKPHLIEVGQKIFEELSRQQIEGSFETHEMEVMDKQGACFDLTKMRVGIPVELELDSEDFDQVTRFKSIQSRERFLLSRGYDSNFAHALAKSLGRFTPVFYTKAASYSLDHDTGFKLKIDFLNFIDLDNKGISFG